MEVGIHEKRFQGNGGKWKETIGNLDPDGIP
jgi:hypothetical protein